MSWWKSQRVWGLEAARIHEEINKGFDLMHAGESIRSVVVF